MGTTLLQIFEQNLKFFIFGNNVMLYVYSTEICVFVKVKFVFLSKN